MESGSLFDIIRTNRIEFRQLSFIYLFVYLPKIGQIELAAFETFGEDTEGAGTCRGNINIGSIAIENDDRGAAEPGATTAAGC